MDGKVLPLRERLREVGEPLIAAHRGMRFQAPENTLPALTLAIDRGADMIEVDVQRTRDGVAVLMHDATVDRTTSGSGRVCDLSLDQVRALDAGSWVGPQFVGVGVPTLHEALVALPPRFPVNIDIKTYGRVDPCLAPTVVDAVHASDRVEYTLISSAAEDILLTLRRLDHTVLTGLITMRVGMEPERLVKAVGADVLHPNWRFFNRISWQRARRQGLPLAAWTVNRRSAIRRLYALGVAILITDHPDLARTAMLEVREAVVNLPRFDR